MAELAATQRAADLARSRFEGGAATQLDALQADRDAFQAEVGLIQARADLAFARVDLRIALGEGEVQ
jgi:outer membrane protein TolC